MSDAKTPIEQVLSRWERGARRMAERARFAVPEKESLITFARMIALVLWPLPVVSLGALAVGSEDPLLIGYLAAFGWYLGFVLPYGVGADE